MLKSKSQSMEAPLALTSKNLLVLSNTKQLICKTTQRERGFKLLKQTKQTKQSKQKLRRSKNNTTVHETIKTKCLDRPELFIDEEGDALGIPKFDACTSWIFFGVTSGWN